MQGWRQGGQGSRLRCHMDRNFVEPGKGLGTKSQRQDREERIQKESSFIWDNKSLMRKNLEGQGEGASTK